MQMREREREGRGVTRPFIEQRRVPRAEQQPNHIVKRRQCGVNPAVRNCAALRDEQPIISTDMAVREKPRGAERGVRTKH
jgi:hypothetical protein